MVDLCAAFAGGNWDGTMPSEFDLDSGEVEERDIVDPSLGFRCVYSTFPEKMWDPQVLGGSYVNSDLSPYGNNYNCYVDRNVGSRFLGFRCVYPIQD